MWQLIKKNYGLKKVVFSYRPLSFIYLRLTHVYTEVVFSTHEFHFLVHLVVQIEVDSGLSCRKLRISNPLYTVFLKHVN